MMLKNSVKIHVLLKLNCQVSVLKMRMHNLGLHLWYVLWASMLKKDVRACMTFDRTARKQGYSQFGYCVSVSGRTVKYYSSLNLNTLIHCSAA